MAREPAVMKLNARGQVVKSARCPRPTHADRTGKGALSSHFLGEQRTFENDRLWSFSCHWGGKPYHVFQATVPDDVPQTVEELEAWKKTQVAARKPIGLA